MLHYLYRLPNKPDGGSDLSAPVGMVSIPDESYMHRVPEGAIQVSEAPVSEDASGTFFEAWRLSDDGEVYVDLEVAKEIKRNQLRERRDMLFKDLDRQQFNAFCSKKTDIVERIEEEKELLRNVTERIDWDQVNTLEEINYVMPPEMV